MIGDPDRLDKVVAESFTAIIEENKRLFTAIIEENERLKQELVDTKSEIRRLNENASNLTKRLYNLLLEIRSSGEKP